jgi:hypothetical protein
VVVYACSLRVGFIACAKVDGSFVWARFPNIDDSLGNSGSVAARRCMLAPGAAFRRHLEPSPWMRLDVAVCEDSPLQQWLQRLASSRAR